MVKSLNLGCGRRFHPAWTNFDFNSSSEEVVSQDLSKGIPVPNDSFDLVYHSHLLEHFSKDDAKYFIEECFRVLRPQGILRVVVPDLEKIVRLYSESLEQSVNGSKEACHNYDWMLIELFDQIVRNTPRGEMGKYLCSEHILNEDFVISRLGIEAIKIIEKGKQGERSSDTNYRPDPICYSTLENVFKPIYRLLRYPSARREWILKIILGHEFDTLKLGRFRKSGEIHQWMYDRFSLKRLLEGVGFSDVIQRTATESYVPNWTSFNLDTEPDGSTYKPDSLFMEAIKPSV